MTTSTITETVERLPIEAIVPDPAMTSSGWITPWVRTEATNWASGSALRLACALRGR